MAKKNYAFLDVQFFPEVGNADGSATLVFRGKNLAGTKSQVTIKMPKYMLVSLVEGITKVAKADQEAAERFVNRLKKAVA